MKSLIALVIAILLGQDPSSSVTFEVAAVRVNKSGQLAAQIEEPPGGRFTATNAKLRTLILRAYEISDNQLVGAPEWTDTERFDINAKLEEEPPSVPPAQPGVRRLALRSLLAERFKLVVHRETRQIPMFALVLARANQELGAMLKPSTTDCSPETLQARLTAAQAGNAVSGVCGSLVTSGRLQFGGKTMADVAKALSGRDVGRPVIDRTGLKGNWDIDLTFKPERVPEPHPGQEPPAIDPFGPSLFIALQEQLGLKLEPIQGPIEVLVVDRVDRPTEN